MTSHPDRRDFLAGVCGLIVAGVAGFEFAAPASAAGIERLKNGKLRITVSQVKELANDGGAVGVTTAKNKPIGIKRINATTYAAFDLKCPHQGVTVMPESDEREWECPGHGAKFDSRTGAKISGPVRRGLTKIKTTLDGDILIVG